MNRHLLKCGKRWSAPAITVSMSPPWVAFTRHMVGEMRCSAKNAIGWYLVLGHGMRLAIIGFVLGR